jgi:putative ABC transport system ATP-binding protein
VIRLANVSKTFNGKRKVTALQDIDLEIARGEMVSIVGPSGSGKSTLLNLIGGLDTPSSGAIAIDGTPLSGLPDDDLTRIRRDKIGFIFQFFNLLPTLNCSENVSIPLHLRGWPKKKSTSALANCSTWLASALEWIICRTSFRAANGSGAPSRERYPSILPCYWQTSRPATSTPTPAPTS